MSSEAMTPIGPRVIMNQTTSCIEAVKKAEELTQRIINLGVERLSSGETGQQTSDIQMVSSSRVQRPAMTLGDEATLYLEVIKNIISAAEVTLTRPCVAKKEPKISIGRRVEKLQSAISLAQEAKEKLRLLIEKPSDMTSKGSDAASAGIQSSSSSSAGALDEKRIHDEGAEGIKRKAAKEERPERKRGFSEVDEDLEILSDATLEPPSEKGRKLSLEEVGELMEETVQMPGSEPIAATQKGVGESSSSITSEEGAGSFKTWMTRLHDEERKNNELLERVTREARGDNKEVPGAFRFLHTQLLPEIQRYGELLAKDPAFNKEEFDSVLCRLRALDRRLEQISAQIQGELPSPPPPPRTPKKTAGEIHGLPDFKEKDGDEAKKQEDLLFRVQERVHEKLVVPWQEKQRKELERQQRPGLGSIVMAGSGVAMAAAPAAMNVGAAMVAEQGALEGIVAGVGAAANLPAIPWLALSGTSLAIIRQRYPDWGRGQRIAAIAAGIGTIGIVGLATGGVGMVSAIPLGLASGVVSAEGTGFASATYSWGRRFFGRPPSQTPGEAPAQPTQPPGGGAAPPQNQPAGNPLFPGTGHTL